MRTCSSSSLVLLLLSLFSLVFASFSPKDLLTAPRRGPAIPNTKGTHAVYTESEYSFDTDSRSGGINLVPIHKNPSSKRIVNDTAASSPIWLDDNTILYISTTNGESTLRTFNTNTSNDHKLVSFHGTIGDLKAIPIDKDTVRFAFSTKIIPSGEIARSNETETPQALVYDRLWVRHWDEWITPIKNSIFSGTLSLQHDQYTINDNIRNMLNSTEEHHDLESPIPPFGGADDFSLSSSLMAFVAKDPHLNPATNTASHVYIVKYNDSKYIEKVNRGPGASSSPVWSPDGKYIAYLEMRVQGYEADRMSSKYY